jgi:hypothetical protein
MFELVIDGNNYRAQDIDGILDCLIKEWQWEDNETNIDKVSKIAYVDPCGRYEYWYKSIFKPVTYVEDLRGMVTFYYSICDIKAREIEMAETEFLQAKKQADDRFSYCIDRLFDEYVYSDER